LILSKTDRFNNLLLYYTKLFRNLIFNPNYDIMYKQNIQEG